VREAVQVAEAQPSEIADRTTWRRRDTALRRFLRTETGSAAVLLVATVIALVWVNVDASSYDDVWRTGLSVRLGHWAVSMELRGWINSGLMTFFFFTIGLEARREFDLGELRDRPRVVLPLLAGLGGMVGAVALYLAFNGGRPEAHGWGVAMSTDTAFALGVLALVGNRVPDRLRGFMLTVVVVDDMVALILIATVYNRPSDCRSAPDRDRPVRGRGGRCTTADPPRPALFRARGHGLGRIVQVGRGPCRDRSRRRADHLRGTGGPHGSGARHRSVPRFP